MEYNFDSEEFRNSSVYKTFINNNSGKGVLKKPIQLGEKLFTDSFWLKISDMFIYTSGILIVVAVGCFLYGISGLSRKSHQESERREHVPSQKA